MRPQPSRALRLLAWTATVLSLISVGVELLSRICTSILFDPLPNSSAVVSYLLLGLLPVAMVLAMSGPRISTEVWGPNLNGESPTHGARWWLPLVVLLVPSGLVVGVSYSLIFLPAAPYAVVPPLWLFGSFCALSPYLNTLALMLLARPLLRVARRDAPRFLLPAGALGVLAAIGVLLLTVVRPLVVGVELRRVLEREQVDAASLARLRGMGAEHEVLLLCHQARLPHWVGLGLGVDTEVESRWRGARRLYYLLTGRPYETATVPRDHMARGFRETAPDPELAEQGGELVGRSLAGLSLQSSSIQGVLDPQRETVYGEWTMELANDQNWEQEARMDLLLPEGGVIDKVSLWINGEERPAAFGATGVVRAAYQEVAVAQRRDPLLVTAKTPEHVMAQCFPVPARGRMRIRLGFSAPLIWTTDREPTLRFVPPVFQQVNFRLSPATLHQISLEGRWPQDRFHPRGDGWSVGRLFSGGAADKPAAYSVTRADPLPQVRQPRALQLVCAEEPREGDLREGWVRRWNPRRASTQPICLTVVLDPTRATGEALTPALREALEQAVRSLPPGSRVGLTRADSQEAVTYQSAAKVELRHWLARQHFHGGLDPAPRLVDLLRRPTPGSDPPVVLWIHGGVPEFATEPAPLLFQLGRPSTADETGSVETAPLISFCLRPGANALADGVAGQPRFASRIWRGTLAEAGEVVHLALRLGHPLRATGVPLGGAHPALNGLYVTNEGLTTGSAAMAARHQERTAMTAANAGPSNRLAAWSYALQPWHAGRRSEEALAPAQRLAIQRRLVTPFTGAVVLENAADYQRFQLNPAAPEGTIPSVPEPGTLLMLGLSGAAAVGWRLRSRWARK